jgi:hypothetical protein
LARDQTSATEVNPEALLPGDLTVWDGHVAFTVGDQHR